MTTSAETVTPLLEICDEIKAAGGSAYKLCYQCGKCDVVCPWNRVRNFSIRKIIRQATFGLAEIESEEIWRCTSCGNCIRECPRGVQQVEIGVSLRRLASDYGVFPGTARPVRGVRGSLAAEGNPLNEKREQRADWARQLNVPEFAEGMEVLYFVGCYYSYDPRLRQVAEAVVRILQQAGVTFGILGSRESCCGESIRKTGGEDIFRTLARSNIKTFIDAGVKKILVGSPHCYHTFRNEYPEFMVNFEVVHMSQFLLELVQQGRLRLRGEYPHRVTYHDPCYLGRHNGIFDEPRQLLAAVPGLELVEMRDSRENSLCCGGGGGRIWMDTPAGERFSDLRCQQARETGAQVLATCCPYCISNFEDSRLNLGYEQLLQVKDLAEIIQEVL